MKGGQILTRARRTVFGVALGLALLFLIAWPVSYRFRILLEHRTTLDGFPWRRTTTIIAGTFASNYGFDAASTEPACTCHVDRLDSIGPIDVKAISPHVYFKVRFDRFGEGMLPLWSILFLLASTAWIAFGRAPAWDRVGRFVWSIALAMTLFAGYHRSRGVDPSLSLPQRHWWGYYVTINCYGDDLKIILSEPKLDKTDVVYVSRGPLVIEHSFEARHYNFSWLEIRLGRWALDLICCIPLAGLCLRKLWIWRRHRKRDLIGMCKHCGYDLRATPGRCPECGRAGAATMNA